MVVGSGVGFYGQAYGREGAQSAASSTIVSEEAPGVVSCLAAFRFQTEDLKYEYHRSRPRGPTFPCLRHSFHISNAVMYPSSLACTCSDSGLVPCFGTVTFERNTSRHEPHTLKHTSMLAGMGDSAILIEFLMALRSS